MSVTARAVLLPGRVLSFAEFCCPAEICVSVAFA